ncbi:2'-5'-oligoadenylate synthase 1A-like [Littorina saxatilis]|uniref:2'-5'-oligoadenylate synthetase 1 domain-containing protein n=1 Tax=Littorina saxatilis TaxID=31220 RepID=A0AAN9GPY0_9CAEN
MCEIPTKVFDKINNDESLDDFHERCVLPTKEEIVSLNKEVDSFVRFLEQGFSLKPYSIARVFKAGSLGNDTAARGIADIELVVFLDGLSSVHDLITARAKLLDHLQEVVKGYDHWRSGLKLKERTTLYLSYVLYGHELTILPGFDIMSHVKRKERVVREIDAVAQYKSIEFVSQQFSASVVPLQVDFVKNSDETAKKVIRLLKQWKLERKLTGLSSYTLELLAIHAAGADFRGNTTDLFVKVLMLIRNYSSVRVAFDENYTSQDYLQYHEIPYIVDVANPFNNLMIVVDMTQASQQAAATLRLRIN